MSAAAPTRDYAVVVDGSPLHVYQGWQLAASLARYGGGSAADVHVYASAGLDADLFARFAARGYRMHRVADDADAHRLAAASDQMVIPLSSIAIADISDTPLLRYQVDDLTLRGFLDPNRAAPDTRAAFACANLEMDRNYEVRIFWDFRYALFPERGSGNGSRGDHLVAKRQFLREQGIEDAASILDVGCGDLEVLKIFTLRNYVGLDQSPNALDRARAARPDLDLRRGLDPSVEPADLVLCFEVLIHQTNLADYRAIVDFLAAKTARTLLVSGYETFTDDMAKNGMLGFHEPLHVTLAGLQAFSRIEPMRITAGNVTVFRCSV